MRGMEMKIESGEKVEEKVSKIIGEHCILGRQR